MAGWLRSAPKVSRAVPPLLQVQIDFSFLASKYPVGIRFKDFLCVFIDKKKKKEETKVPVRDMKEKGGEEEKKDKPKAHAPSHAKIRSIGKCGELFGSFSNSASCPVSSSFFASLCCCPFPHQLCPHLSLVRLRETSC